MVKAPLGFDNSEKIAYTGDVETKVNGREVRQQCDQKNIQDLSVVYANILFHEVFYLGLLNHGDDWTADDESLGSRIGDMDAPVNITPEQAEAINNAVGDGYDLNDYAD